MCPIVVKSMGMTKRPRDEDERSCQGRIIGRYNRFKFARRSRPVPVGIETSHGVTWIRGHKLGQGGFASVYSATSKSDASLVFLDDDNDACSVLPSEFAVKSAEISKSSSLRTELEIYSHLNSSSYLVRCFGDEITKSDDGKLYYNILLEKCCGGSLGTRIRNSGGVGLQENEVRSITRDIVRGLCYIHGRGYVHCDIKPDNILLVPTCCNGFRAKIGDLGLAKEAYFDPADEVAEGCCGVRGTWRYMPPEFEEYETQCWLSDIWALGCVVIEMISGKLVWSSEQSEGFDMNDYLSLVAYSSKLPEIPSKISQQGRDFCKRCLHRDIDERWSAPMLLRHPFLSPIGLHNEEQCQS